MDHKEKLKHANEVLSAFMTGERIKDVESSLRNQGIFQYDIDAIMFMSSNLFYDRFKSRLEEAIDEDGSLLLLDELEHTDEEWWPAYYRHAHTILVQPERENVIKQIEGKVSLDDIVNSTDLRLMSENDIKKLYSERQEEISRKTREGHLLFVGGIIFLAIFLIGLVSGRVLFLTAIGATACFYRAYSS